MLLPERIQARKLVPVGPPVDDRRVIFEDDILPGFVERYIPEQVVQPPNRECRGTPQLRGPLRTGLSVVSKLRQRVELQQRDRRLLADAGKDPQAPSSDDVAIERAGDAVDQRVQSQKLRAPLVELALQRRPAFGGQPAFDGRPEMRRQVRGLELLDEQVVGRPVADRRIGGLPVSVVDDAHDRIDGLVVSDRPVQLVDFPDRMVLAVQHQPPVNARAADLLDLFDRADRLVPESIPESVQQLALEGRGPEDDTIDRLPSVALFSRHQFETTRPPRGA